MKHGVAKCHLSTDQMPQVWFIVRASERMIISLGREAQKVVRPALALLWPSLNSNWLSAFRVNGGWLTVCVALWDDVQVHLDKTIRSKDVTSPCRQLASHSCLRCLVVELSSKCFHIQPALLYPVCLVCLSVCVLFHYFSFLCPFTCPPLKRSAYHLHWTRIKRLQHSWNLKSKENLKSRYTPRAQ